MKINVQHVDLVLHSEFNVLELIPQPKLYKPSTLNIQMKLILLWVWAERAVLGRPKTALKFKYEIEIG